MFSANYARRANPDLLDFSVVSSICVAINLCATVEGGRSPIGASYVLFIFGAAGKVDREDMIF